MRPHNQQNKDLSAQQLYEDIALLVCESRLGSSSNRTVAWGPHCPQAAGASKSIHHKHVCDAKDSLCQKADHTRQIARKLSAQHLPMCVCVYLVPDCCDERAMLLEKWTVQIHSKRSRDRALLGPFLLQAIRSHLAFSQYSAWLLSTKTKFQGRAVYRITLPGEHNSRGPADVSSGNNPNYKCTFDCQPGPIDSHSFPDCELPNLSHVLCVTVDSMRRQEHPPRVTHLCVCMQHSPERFTDEAQLYTAVDGIATGSGLELEFNNSGSSSPDSDKEHCAVASGVATGMCNPLFGASDSDRAALLYRTPPRSRLQQPKPTNNSNNKDASPPDDVVPVKFFIDDEMPPSTPTKQPAMSSNNPQQQSPQSPISPSSSSAVVFRRSKRNVTQKILFSSSTDASCSSVDRQQQAIAELTLSRPTPDKQQQHTSSQSPQQCTATSSSSSASTIALDRHRSFVDGTEWWRRQQHAHQARVDGTTSRRPSSMQPMVGLHRVPFSSTGLPLTSSPAPLKRNKHSFDFDVSLNTVAGLKSAFYHHDQHYESSSDSEIETGPVCKSAPARTNLLGNFEESALKGRIKPFGSLDGFTLELAASGAFCPAHVRLPVTTFFFNLHDNDAPSPFLGHCSLEPPLLAKKGYHVPRRGTVQAAESRYQPSRAPKFVFKQNTTRRCSTRPLQTLFNPNETVVKMFVVRYDLSDMPVYSQTFVRQRTFFMPQHATLAHARQHRSWLRYLIHLRFATSRSGRLYIHTDIRMLFSRKSELDAYNVEMDQLKLSDSSSAASQQSQVFELRSFIEMPRNPKYSPRKSNSAANNNSNNNNMQNTGVVAEPDTVSNHSSDVNG